MASLRGIYSGTATEVHRLLNLGKAGLAPAKALLLKSLATGNADPLTQKLAAEVFSPAKRGRRATGLYRWFDIGSDNSHLKDEGLSHSERLALLQERYGRSTSHIEKCITEYEAGRDAQRDYENELPRD